MRRALALALVAAAPVVAGCGGGGSSGSSGPLAVSAAASLKPALPVYRPGERYSFAGSDQLAAQIRAGARPDVFAAADTKLPQSLFAVDLVERPVTFATNRLVIAVPAGRSHVRSLADLERPGVTIAAGSPSVPVGSYTRQVLGRVPAARAHAILANIRSSEPDVAGVVGKVSERAVDAGFVYITDVIASRGRMRAIPLPASLQPKVAYAAAVVKGSKHAAGARAFVDGLRGRRARTVLLRAGFGPPP